MKKREMTAEQIAARDAKRAKFTALAKQVASMTDAQRAEILNQCGAVVTCEGRALSLKNTLVSVLQFPGVSMVGGFRQWLRCGRCVKKGEHGFSIWFPLGVGASERAQSEAEGSAEAGSGQRFGTTTVFDVSQTCELAVEQPAEEAAGVLEGAA